MRTPNLSTISAYTGPTAPNSEIGHRSEKPEIPVPELQNIVSTAYLGVKLDLRHIAQTTRNAECNPKRFAAVIIRIREPKTTALIF